MTAKKNPQPQPVSKNSDLMTYCSKCGGLIENNLPPADEEIFPDDEFDCPACCCGIYIEVKEEQ